MNPSVSGNFKPYIEGLIEQKRSIGYPYDSSAQKLKAFGVFCLENYPDETVLTKKIAMHWAEKRQEEHVNGLMRRITPIRQLAKYMNRLGIDAYIIPPGIPGKQTRYVPHIFTDQELQAFFTEIDRCAVSPYSPPARHLVIPVFFRVLYCCGLRLSEARLLKVEDVDLETGKLTIRQSKGNKDRNVMLSEEVLDLCRIYHAKVSRIFPDRVGFFPNQCGKYYNRGIIGYWFHLFWNKTGITNIASGNTPRVHDFRHTFAVKRLNLWVQEGKDLNTYLPYLSMYLGHAHLTETDYYLHFVPEFFPLFKEKTREKCANLIPEVKYEAG
jgi:integrase/recombinase XerD